MLTFMANNGSYKQREYCSASKVFDENIMRYVNNSVSLILGKRREEHCKA